MCVGSSEYESASQHSSSSEKDTNQIIATVPTQCPDQDKSSSDCVTTDNLPERSNSVAGTELQLPRRPPTDGYSLSYPRSHRRNSSEYSITTGSPSRTHHRRIQSLSISAYSSRSTSAYSTLSERSAHVPPITAGVGDDDIESIISSRTRITTQSQVEQSRVDTSSVINELLQQQESNLCCSAEEEPGGLKMYVNKSKGDIVVAGPDMER